MPLVKVLAPPTPLPIVPLLVIDKPVLEKLVRCALIPVPFETWIAALLFTVVAPAPMPKFSMKMPSPLFALTSLPAAVVTETPFVSVKSRLSVYCA